VDVVAWGSTEGERASHFPCDDLRFAHDIALFRAISIAAPAHVVYRWLTQLRVAPYSYDWIDNFGRPSPARLTPGLDALAIGQPIMLIFRLAAFEPGKSLTVELASRVYAHLFGAIAGSYRVDAVSGGCRLIAKILVRYPTGPHAGLVRTTLPALDLIMFRKQLQNLQRLAERSAARMRYRYGTP
jgi:hypothetical protein